MTFDIDNDLPLLDPSNPRDQDMLVAVDKALANGVSNYPNIRDLVRIHGSKEAAYEALLAQMPELEHSLTSLRIFMGLASKAERELVGAN